MATNSHDVVIIGGGPAGMTAGIYTAREMLDTLLIEKDTCGGLPASTESIENYPGFPDGVNGADLMAKFKQQSERFGVKINEFEEVRKIESQGNLIRVITDKTEYEAHALIVASGSVPKKLNVPGESEFMGKGVSYCAICDGPLYKNKDVAIIGCGNSGLQEAGPLLGHVKTITFIEFLPYMTAEKILQDRLQKNPKTKFLLNHALTAINGKNIVDSVTVKDRKTGEEKKISLSGVFIYAGFIPNSKFLEGIADLDKYKYIVTNEDMQTSVPGIFAVGDIRSKKVRQIDSACADATIAAIAARDYIKEIKK
ncbi:MAG: thioredoxin-disulfide reductase [Candidatus Omnitrophica bacterium]|nr:thioredoxin-disulfide reductase [Candidatus Omnitrophota bacterium]HOX54775.1 thioredoxin-disulfide reductase [Candidatus Omnitrophota bacterium]